MPHLHFLLVRSSFCIRLSSDSTSRWTPLPSLTVLLTRVRKGLSPSSLATYRSHGFRFSIHEENRKSKARPQYDPNIISGCRDLRDPAADHRRRLPGRLRRDPLHRLHAHAPAADPCHAPPEELVDAQLRYWWS